MSRTLSLNTPEDFNFKRTILSHGWCELPPFEIDEEKWILSTVVAADRAFTVEIFFEDGLKVKVTSGKPGKKVEAKIISDINHILRLDDDFSDFYKSLRAEKEFSWIAKEKSGRILRSATVFEDLVKSICTTNCSWSLTKKMVTNLVEKLGEPAENGKHLFPTAEAMANMPAKFYQEEIRAGYRGPYLKELAERAVKGELNLQSWLNSGLTTDELKKEMKKIKGVGDYAAENLLKLVGRYDGLALDSWLRSRFYEKYRDGVPCDDKEIYSHYERYGKWRGLFIWLEMTKKWV